MNKRTIAAGKRYARLLCCAILLLLSVSVSAQEKKITGTVVNPADNKPLPNISVLVKGTTRGTATDVDGRFSINAGEQETLIFSAVGFRLREIKVGKQETINVQMVEGENELESVIVTALGIKRDQKGLSYANQSISGDELTNAKSNNFIGALSGKVAGLNLISPGSGPVNSVRVSLRGDNSLNANGNNALIVLDGVPMSSEITTSGVSDAYGAGVGNDVPIDFGNGIADINPDDIESVTVLKGASATALYGNRASNGAILITTKAGSRKNKGIGVTINSNTSINSVLKWPDYQYEYGQGALGLNTAGEQYYSYGASADGLSTSGTSSAFGPKFNGQNYFQYDPAVEGRGAERTPWVPYKDNIKGLFRTGSTFSNSISLEGGNEQGSARASVTHTKNEWIMLNTGFERINAALSFNYKVSDKLKISGKANYTNKKSDNLPSTGYNNQAIAYFMIFQNPNVNLDWYRPIWRKGLEGLTMVRPYSSFIDNPYAIIYEMTNSMNSNGVVGNLTANYTISKKFELMVRGNMNQSSEMRQQRRPYATNNYKQGYYKEQNISFLETNTDFLLTFKEKIGRDFRVTASAGANMMNKKYRLTNASVEGLAVPGTYKLTNGLSTPFTFTDHSNEKTNSVYGLASFSWKDKIFLDVTGRNDWTSTLPSSNWSFFYPSIGTSFILSELFQLPAAITYAKFRLSAAQVGNDTEPHSDKKYYGASQWSGSATVPSTLPNLNLKPELTRSYEAGLEVNLFNSRIGMDLTVYNNITRNQIIRAPIDISTGFTRAILNGGEVRNQGIELVLRGRPISRPNFKWNTTITWAKNENKVLSLPDEGDPQQIIATSGLGVVNIIATKGGTTGDIYGQIFVRAPDGQIVYDNEGAPLINTELKYVGSAYPGWRGGIMNEFSVNNFTFSFLVDGQYGGIVYSQTHHKMTEQGKLQHTLRGREDMYIIGEGVVKDGNGFKQNTYKAKITDFYADYWRRANVESNSFDASYLKLREVRLEYNVPRKYTEKLRMQAVSIALYGRDLAMLTSFPMFDPETAALNGSSIMPGVEMGQMPSSRTMGVNITVKF